MRLIAKNGRSILSEVGESFINWRSQINCRSLAEENNVCNRNPVGSKNWNEYFGH